MAQQLDELVEHALGVHPRASPIAVGVGVEGEEVPGVPDRVQHASGRVDQIRVGREQSGVLERREFRERLLGFLRTAEFGERVTMIHNEVYTSRDLEQTTDAVQAYKLPSEPVLFLAGADGVIFERLDNIYDEVELQASLERLVA